MEKVTMFHVDSIDNFLAIIKAKGRREVILFSIPIISIIVEPIRVETFGTKSLLPEIFVSRKRVRFQEAAILFILFHRDAMMQGS